MIVASLTLAFGVLLLQLWRPVPEPDIHAETVTPEGGMAEILDATEKPARALAEERAVPPPEGESSEPM